MRAVEGDCGVDVAIGAGQDGFVAVHNGLHPGGGVGQCTIDRGAVQCSVDGCQVVGCYTAHSGCRVHAQGGGSGCGAIGLGRSRNGVQGGTQTAQGGVHHALQFGLGIHICVRGNCAKGKEHGRLTEKIDACYAQRSQIGCAQGLGLGSGAASGCHHISGCSRHALDLSLGAHGGGATGVNGTVQQCESGTGRRHTNNARDPDGAVLLAGERCSGVLATAVSTGQNGVEGVHNGLHFGCGVSQGTRDGDAVECAIDGGKVGAGDTGDAGRRVDRGGQSSGACIVGVGRCLDGVQGDGDARNGGSCHGL